MQEGFRYLNERLQTYTSTIFAEMSALALATDSINLGQGFPDVDGPEAIRSVAIEAIESGHNQYPPGRGLPELRNAVAQHQMQYYGLSFDPESEILVTAGATEAIASTLLALCERGDEVVMFEPFYDSYAACVAMAGANRRVVTLRPPNWSFDPDEFDRSLTDKTRLVILNSPHNPTGKVFSREELAFIAERCVAKNLIVVTDEVYEHLVFEGDHVPIASLPGMAERTVTISSAGKTFSFTGWKIGWLCAPSELTAAARTVKQYLTYSGGTPFQIAVAYALASGDRFIEGIAAELARKRDLLASGLADLGLTVYSPAGSYFVTTDISSLGFEDGEAFCWSLPERCGVVAVPSAAFYDDKTAGQSLVRWTFCKKVELLEEALVRLKHLV